MVEKIIQNNLLMEGPLVIPFSVLCKTQITQELQFSWKIVRVCLWEHLSSESNCRIIIGKV